MKKNLKEIYQNKLFNQSNTMSDTIKIEVPADAKILINGKPYEPKNEKWRPKKGEKHLFNNSEVTPLWSYNMGDSVESVAISSNGQKSRQIPYKQK